MDTFSTETRSHLKHNTASAWTPAQPGNVRSDSGEVTLNLDQVVPLLESVEISRRPSQRLFSRADLRALAIHYPCQIRIPMLGDSCQGGIESLYRGIQARNRIDGLAACQTLFTRKVQGAFPEYLLVEPHHAGVPELCLSITWGRRADGFWLELTQAEDFTCPSPGAGPSVKPRFFWSQDWGSDDVPSIALGLDASTVDAIAHLLQKLEILITWAGLSAGQLTGWIEPVQGESIQAGLDPVESGPVEFGPVEPGQKAITIQGGWLRFATDSPLRRQAKAALQSRTVIHPAIVLHRESAPCQQHPAAPFPGDASPIGEAPASQPNTSRQNTNETPVSPLKALTSSGAPSGAPSGALLKQPGAQTPDPAQSKRLDSPQVVRLGEGNIAVISNGLARTMATLEQLQQRGASIAGFVNLQEAKGAEAHSSGEVKTELKATALDKPTHLEHRFALASLISAEPLPLDAFTVKRQLAQALQDLARLRGVKVILINWRSSSLPCRILADALIEYQSKLALQARRPAQPLPLVVRMAGEGAEMGHQRLLDQEAITLETTVEAAISRSMGLARMAKSWVDG